MNVNKGPIYSPNYRIHLSNRLSTDYSQSCPKSRCTSLKGNEKSTFVRLLLNCAREAHEVNRVGPSI